MKKRILVPLTLLAGLLVVGHIPNFNTNEKLEAVTKTTEIEMKKESFSNWNDEAGVFAPKNATFWGEEYPFFALDTFYRGEIKEGWTGTLSLNYWIQYTQYIYFQWGGANNNDDKVKMVIHYGYDGEKYLYSKTLTNDTFVGNPMLLRYFKIPDEEYKTLDATNGFRMYIDLVDDKKNGEEGGYGFHNFGYLHVNQTEEQVSDAMRYYLNHMDVSTANEWVVNKAKEIYGHYFTNIDLKNVFLRTVENVNEDFEDINRFLNHWYLDYKYDNYKENTRYTDFLLSKIVTREIADDIYSSNMPFNNTERGSYFSGWHDNPTNQGYIANDNAIYRFVSRPFKLDGTGLVSIKMAGRGASLHVIDAETQEDLAWADLRSYVDEGDEHYQFLNGFNTVTMVRHYINLSAFLGKTIQLALADVFEDRWACSYFDDLVTYYDEYPSYSIDALMQTNKTEENPYNFGYSYYYDRYIASTHIDNDPNGLKYVATKEEVENVDESPAYLAYLFVNEFINKLRTPANEFDIEKVDDSIKKQIVKKYLALDNDTKEIINNSKDFQYSNVFDDEWYKRAATVTNNIGPVMEDLVSDFVAYTVSFAPNGGTGEMKDDTDIRGEYTLPTCTFIAPKGKVFDAWMIDGTTYQAGEKINVNSNITLTATWKDEIFNVTFNSNGGTGTMSPITVNSGEKLKLPTCTFIAPEGKEFKCWIVKNTSYNEGDEVDIIADTEVFASWKNLKYKVIFDSNGGTGTMSDLEILSGQQLELPACTFTAPEGKEFDAWMIDEVKYNVGDKVDVNGNMTIIATWKDKEIIIVKYTVTIDPNGGVGERIEAKDVLGEYTLPTCTFIAPEGKEFDGWIINGQKYQVGDKIEVNADTLIKASWKDVPKPEPTPSSSSSGCGGEIVTSSILLSSIALIGFALLTTKKFKNKK